MIKIKNFFIIIFIILLINGCATAYKISKVNIGMTKQEVIEKMGPPASVSAQGNIEYLNYAFSETDDQAFYGITRPYYVRLVNGHVESYGRTGDFDSTQKPTLRIETDENIKQNVKIDNSDDLYTELKKLKELMDSGIITNDEFETRKKKILEKY